jgi:endonuclease YncB( thermonuclease family)
MRYHIIKGRFHVKGYSPDGDSIRFQADNDHNNPKKQLRFEAIDALETHYEESHQPRSFGVAALEVLLSQLGITNVVYNLALSSICEANDNSVGFIASRYLDTYDRPVSLVFPGDCGLTDGKEVELDQIPMDKNINLKMLSLGLVYPTFYSEMEDALMKIFSDATRQCRAGLTGLWALDRTRNFTLWNISTVSDDVVILPKLFRRLTTFFKEKSDFTQLPAYLAGTGDKVLVASTGEKTTLAKLLRIKDRTVGLPYDPEDLVFDPKS